MSPENKDYYTGRAEIELKLGDLAVDARVAAVHYELAFRYSIVAAQGGAKAPLLRLVWSDAGQLAA